MSLSLAINTSVTTSTDAISGVPASDYYYKFNGVTLELKTGDNSIPIISYGSGSAGDAYLVGDAIIDLSAFGTTYDKSYYLGNSEAKAENWDYPFTYFDVANPSHWKISELNYRLIEVQKIGNLKQLYAKLIYDEEVLQGLTELLMYDTPVVDETGVKSYIGFDDGVGILYNLSRLSYINNTDAYGEFTFKMNPSTDVLISTIFINDQISNYNGSDGNRYSLTFYNDDLYLIRKNDGGSNPIILFMESNVSILNWYEIKITRNSTIDEYVTGAVGTFALYIRGGRFGNDYTLIATVFDNTHTTTLYYVLDGVPGTMYSDIYINNVLYKPSNIIGTGFDIVGYYKDEIL